MASQLTIEAIVPFDISETFQIVLERRLDWGQRILHNRNPKCVLEASKSKMHKSKFQKHNRCTSLAEFVEFQKLFGCRRKSMH